MVEEPIDLSVDLIGWAERVPKDKVDYHAYYFHKGVCVECGKGPQEAAGNPHMENDKTHCYDCYLRMSREAAQERYRLRQIEKPKAVVTKKQDKENWYE